MLCVLWDCGTGILIWMQSKHKKWRLSVAHSEKERGTVGLWLMHSTPVRIVRPGLSPGRGHCVVFLGKTRIYSHSAFSIQVYRWVPANLLLG